MTKTHEPVVWSLFGAGGMLTAMLTPMLVLITGILVPIGIISPMLMRYERMLAFAQNPLGKLVLLVIITLPLWHAAHRIYHAHHDFLIHTTKVHLVLTYGLALLLTIVTLVLLLMVGF